MTPWHHSETTVKKFGGKEEDYIRVHDWFDETKAFTGNWTHRAMRHHAAGIQWAIEKFGDTITNSNGDKVPTKLIAEHHVLEDCGFIPTISDWTQNLAENPRDWMLKVKVKKTKKLELN